MSEEKVVGKAFISEERSPPYKSSRFQGNESELPHRKCWTVLTFSVPSHNVDSPVCELLQPGVTLSLYMPVTNPVLAKAVWPPWSLALHLPRYVVTRIILVLLIKFSVHSSKQVGTVVQLLSGRHMNRGLTPGKRFLSSKRPHRLWGPPHLLSSGIQRSLPWGKWPGRETSTHLHLIPRLRMCGAVPLRLCSISSFLIKPSASRLSKLTL